MFVRYYYKEGDKIAGGERILSVYSEESDGALIAEIEKLDEQIGELSGEYVTLTSNDVLKVENYIDEDIVNYNDACRSGNVSASATSAKRLSTLFDIKNARTLSPEAEKKELEEKKHSLEGRLSASMNEVTAPASGVLSASVDGFERSWTKEELSALTVGEFDRMAEQEEKDEEGACKIVDNYRWYFACKVDAGAVVKESVGNSVTIAMPDGDVTGKIMSISASDGTSCLLVIESDRDFPGIESKRKVSASLIFGRHEGFLLPKKAFHIYDGAYGVFIDKGNRTLFRKTAVAYEDGENVIVSEGEGTELKLYDTVIIEGDLSEFYGS